MNNTTTATEPRQLRKVSQQYTRQSQIGMVMHNLMKNKGAMAGLAIIVLLILTAVFANFLFDYETEVVGIDMELIAAIAEDQGFQY